jgi:tetratricopeptide (TPR) repeat protein
MINNEARGKPSRAFLCLAFLAAFALSAAVPVRAGDAVTPIARAEQMYKDGKYKEAIALLNDYLTANPKDATALVDRGDDYAALGEDKAAVADYTAAIAVNPDFAYAYASRCDSRNSLDQNAEALPDCDKAIELDPKMAYPYRIRALIELQEGNPKAALADTDSAIGISANSAYSYQLRCRAYDDLGDLDRALPDCNDAIRLNPDMGEGYFQRGRVEIAQQNWTGAIADFTKSESIQPGPNGHYWLALSRFKNGDLTEALSEDERYIQMKSDDGDGYLLRAQIEQKMGNTAQAKTSATDALRHYRIANDTNGAAKAQALLDSLKP